MTLEIIEQEKRVHKFFDDNYEYNLKPLEEYIEALVTNQLGKWPGRRPLD
jgi:hypothetical protein